MKARRLLLDELVTELSQQSKTGRRKTLALHKRVMRKRQRPRLARKLIPPEPVWCRRPRGVVITVTVPLRAALEKRLARLRPEGA